MTPHERAMANFKTTMVGEAYTAIDHLLDAELEHCIESYLACLLRDKSVEEAVASTLSLHADRGNLDCAKAALARILNEVT